MKKKPGPKSRWRDELYVEIYDLAKQGHRNSQIAKIIGVSLETLKLWIRNKPALKAAITRARNGDESNVKAETLLEYVYNQLPEHLQKLWTELSSFDEEPNALRKVQMLVGRQSVKVRQHLFIHALVACNFNASEACRRIGISRTIIDQWAGNDSGFGELLDQVVQFKKDLFESALIGLVKQGDTSAVIFANRTQNRDRGYDTRQQVDINVSGNVLHGTVNLDDMGLPVEVKRQLLAAARAKREGKPLPLPAAEEEVVEMEEK